MSVLAFSTVSGLNISALSRTGGSTARAPNAKQKVRMESRTAREMIDRMTCFLTFGFTYSRRMIARGNQGVSYKKAGEFQRYALSKGRVRFRARKPSSSLAVSQRRKPGLFFK